MFTRKMGVTLGAATLAAAGLTLSVLAPAGAAGTEDKYYLQSNSGFADGTNLPAGAILGAGSDTIQFVDGALAQAYDGLSTTDSGSPMVSLSACYEPGSIQLDGKTKTPGSTIQTSCTYPTGANYPFTVNGTALNGVGAGTSGDGANLLDNAGVTHSNIAFARTSGPKDQTNLGLFPFALDQVVAVVSNNVPSNAPATLTRAQLFGIYQGNYTNWDQLGGKNAPIHAYYPFNSASGTLAAFTGDLDLESTQGTSLGLNVIVPSSGKPSATGHFVSNIAVNSSKLVASGEQNKQIVEHDPAAIENDPDAIAPFSYSRIIMDEKTAGNKSSAPIKALGGWVLNRAVYNELRDATTTPATSLTGVNPDWIANSSTSTSPTNLVNSLFGPSGYLCSSAAAPIMQKWGFFQLNAGTCGVETHGAPASLGAIGAPTVSKTTETVSGTTVNITVASGDPTVTTMPTGKAVVSYVSANSLPNAKVAPKPVTVTLSGGKASVKLPTGTPGGKWEVATSYLGDSTFQASWSDGENTPATPATVTAPAPNTTTALSETAGVYGKTAGTVTATVKAGTTPATGIMTFKIGTMTRQAAISNGVAKVTLSKTQKPASYKVTASYAGNTSFKKSTSAAKTLVVKKASASLSESFPSSVAHNASTKGTVTVKITGGTATGTVQIKQGSKVIVKGSLKSGKVTLTIAKGKLGGKGTKHLTIAYGGSADVNKASKAFTITQK